MEIHRLDGFHSWVILSLAQLVASFSTGFLLINNRKKIYSGFSPHIHTLQHPWVLLDLWEIMCEHFSFKLEEPPSCVGTDIILLEEQLRFGSSIW